MKSLKSFREEFGKALVDIGRGNKDLVVIDADVCKSTKTEYFARAFPDRFIQVGISEQDLVGIACGIALAGKIPVASTFAMFLFRAWEQIRNTVARDNLNVKFVVTHGGLSDYLDGSSHQCLEDIAIMRVIPNMKVVIPADTLSMKKLLLEGILEEGPFYMRLGRDYAPVVYHSLEDVTLGKTTILREGDDICIVACGIMVSLALRAYEELKKKGINATVLDFHTIKPFDVKTLVKFAKKVNGFVVAEEHNIIGGLGSAIAEVLSEQKPKPIRRVGVYDCFGMCSRDYLSLLQYYGLTSESIIKAAEEILNEI